MGKHIPVLVRETIDALSPKLNAVVVDATLGGGGHARELIAHLGSQGAFVGIDADRDAIEEFVASVKVKKHGPSVHAVAANFRTIDDVLARFGIEHADAILADLGWRTDQFLTEEDNNNAKSNGKGFSFMRDEPLLMTFGDPEDYLFTAKDVVNEWEEEHIADVIYGYGEERASRRIARALVEYRKKKSIETSKELADIIEKAVGKKGRIHPATKTFQALRMVVNDELGALEEFLHKSIDLLSPHGRIAIISFHSLEDRIVKQTFKSYTRDQKGELVNKKPITPSKEEVDMNKRARSAKLRIYEKTL